MITPANTPATPPNFPETLLAFSKMSTSGGGGPGAEGGLASSPFAKHHAMAMSPPGAAFSAYQMGGHPASPLATQGVGAGGASNGLAAQGAGGHRFASPTAMAPIKATSQAGINCNQAR